MDRFFESFVRRADGVWEGVRFAEFEGPNGRIQVTPGSCFTRGTNFMGIDLAEWLDHRYRSEHLR